MSTATAAADGTRLPFEELRELQKFLERLLESAVPTMTYYYDERASGFVHRARKAEPDWSRASTATCLAFLEESGRWALKGEKVVVDGTRVLPPWTGSQQSLADEIVKGEKYTGPDPLKDNKRVTVRGAWASAGLGVDNPFTVGFLLNALQHLRRLGVALDDAQRARVAAKAETLLTHLETNGTGGARILPFPDTAFLTYKAVTGLDAAKDLLADPDPTRYDTAFKQANAWAWRALRAELASLAARQVDADPFELAYALLIIVRTQQFNAMAPADRGIVRHALDVFFAHQTEHGTWPRSRPLFMYPAVGNAYCYDYELLTQMLGESQLTEMLLGKLPALAAAARAVDRTKYPLGAGYGWASGHHRQDTSAESWATASVYHYLWSLQRLVAEAIRVEVFRYAEARYDPPATGLPGKTLDTSGFADSVFQDSDGASHSLITVVNERFLAPIAGDHPRSIRGLPLGKDTPCSAIVYGPPGTSKTTLATLVAQALGWPHLPLDPSHLTRNGLDRLHEESNRIFGMLAATERVVVLLDEFDELVRERGSGSSEFVSRFLTTSMLPKIQALANRRRIVWLLATNHIEIFDSAIRRPGRFDMIVPLLPPTAQEKLERFPHLRAIAQAGTQLPEEALGDLTQLTWGETSELDARLATDSDADQAAAAIAAAASTCTMQAAVEDGQGGVPKQPDNGTPPADEAVSKSWTESLDTARRFIRLP